MVPRGDGFPPSLVRHRAPQPSWLVCLERNRFINQQDNAEKSSLWWGTASSGFQKLRGVFELSPGAAHLFLCAG